MSKKNILVVIEDTYGCSTVLRRCSNFKPEVEYVNYEIMQYKDGATNIGTIKTKLWKILELDVDYVILIFDLDKKSNIPSDVVLKYDDLLKMFNENANKKGKSKCINITYDNREDYMGERTVVLPIFFCFENLLLYSNKLLFFTPNVTFSDKHNDSICIIAEEFTECLLAYEYSCIKTNNYEYSPQVYIKYFSEFALNNIFPNISRDIIEKKDTDKLFDEIINIDPEFIENEIINNLTRKAIFNKPFVDLLSIENDNEIERFFKKYCFQNYKSDLEYKMKIYEQMLLWNPSVENRYYLMPWYNDYIKLLSTVRDLKGIEKCIQGLNIVCDWFVKDAIKRRKSIYSI